MFPGLYEYSRYHGYAWLQFRCPYANDFERAIGLMNGGARECLVKVYANPGRDWESLTERSWMYHALVAERLAGKRGSWYHIRRATDRDDKQLARRAKHIQQKKDALAAKWRLQQDMCSIVSSIPALLSTLCSLTEGRVQDVWADSCITPEWRGISLDCSLTAWRHFVARRPKASVSRWLDDIYQPDRENAPQKQRAASYAATIDRILTGWKRDKITPPGLSELTYVNGCEWPQVLRWLKKHSPEQFKKD